MQVLLATLKHVVLQKALGSIVDGTSLIPGPKHS